MREKIIQQMIRSGTPANHPLLERMASIVLAYRPKPKTKAAKRRIRKKKRLSKGKGN